MTQILTCLLQDHEPLIILIGAAICSVSALTTFTVLQQAQREERRGRWIALASLVSGIGIWSTHFIAMLAYRSATPISFDVTGTFLSALLAVVITGVGWTVSLSRKRWAWAGGAVAGAGIGAMHFAGMSAVHISGEIVWSPGLVLLSLAIGAMMVTAATAEQARVNSLIPWRPALLFVAAICGMHFLAMAAMTIRPDPSLPIPAEAIDHATLALIVALIALAIFMISFAVVLFDRASSIRRNFHIQQALNESESLNRGIIAAMPEGVSLLDLDGTVLFANQTTLDEYGLPDSSTLIGRGWGWLFPDEVQVQANHALERARNGNDARILLQLGNGDERWWDIIIAAVRNASGTPVRLIATSREVTEHKKAEERANWSASHDALTLLPNRLAFQRRLERMTNASIEARGRFAVALLDVDDFKQVNDTGGHDSGDAVLRAIAARIRSVTGANDFVARLGGDEFAILLDGAHSVEVLQSLLARITQALAQPCAYGSGVVDCHASIGASIYPDHGADNSQLLKSADIALYQAKSGGGGKFKLFEPWMAHEVRQRSSMLAAARDGLEDNRILPYYQPKIDLHTGALSGFEALLRWRHDTRGLQQPHTISAAFEDPCLAGQISDRMIAGVLEDIRYWRNNDINFGHVAINAAAADFRRGSFAEDLLERMLRCSVPPECVQVEVTETVFLGRGAEHVHKALTLLSRSGVRIALDDFGTGYASLSHLKQFPVDIIKIDRSFIRQLAYENSDAVIVHAVINLGRNLNLEVIAEGVETPAQRDCLVTLGCNVGQGHLYGKAAPADRVPEISSKFRMARCGCRMAA